MLFSQSCGTCSSGCFRTYFKCMFTCWCVWKWGSKLSHVGEIIPWRCSVLLRSTRSFRILENKILCSSHIFPGIVSLILLHYIFRWAYWKFFPNWPSLCSFESPLAHLRPCLPTIVFRITSGVHFVVLADISILLFNVFYKTPEIKHGLFNCSFKFVGPAFP